MANVFFAWVGIQNNDQYNVPIQSNFNKDGAEWEKYCTGKLRHINIRYFFVKDRVDNGKVKIEYLPTQIMSADYFTKPLKGTVFKISRDFIMG